VNYWKFAVNYWKFAVNYWKFAVNYWKFAVNYWKFAVLYVLRVIFIVNHSFIMDFKEKLSEFIVFLYKKNKYLCLKYWKFAAFYG